MTAVLYILIVLATVSQSWSTKAFNKSGGSSFVFNALKAGTALAMFGLMSAWGFSFSTEGLVFGVLYGSSLSLSMYAGYTALTLGPMSLTSMLVSLSVVIPVVWGVAVRGEELNGFKWAAFALLLLALLFMNVDKLKKTGAKGNTNYVKWAFFVAVTFLANGACSILQKEYQAANPSGGSDEFMFFAMLVCTLVYLPVCLFKERGARPGLSPASWLGVFAGCMTGLSSFFTLILAGSANASVLFPLLSAGTLIGALLCGGIVFRERLKLGHYLAMLFGILTVVFMKL